MADKLQDRYSNISDFEEILEEARMAAGTDKEVDFVSKTKKNYDDYGGRMFWSDKQDRWLRIIAGADY